MTKKISNNIVKYKKAPEAPRRFKSAYMFFSTEKHKSIRREMVDKEIATTVVAKLVSIAWKSLSEEERAKWNELARRDKARFEIEKAMYKGPWKVAVSGRPLKDPKAPKRPMSAFLSFSNSKRSGVKAQHSKMSNAEISRILAQLWRDAPAEERQLHIEQEFRLRQKYKIAIAEWRKKASSEFNAARQEREEKALQFVDDETVYVSHVPSKSDEDEEDEAPFYPQASPQQMPSTPERMTPQFYSASAYTNAQWPIAEPLQGNVVTPPQTERPLYSMLPSDTSFLDQYFMPSPHDSYNPGMTSLEVDPYYDHRRDYPVSNAAGISNAFSPELTFHLPPLSPELIGSFHPPPSHPYFGNGGGSGGGSGYYGGAY